MIPEHIRQEILRRLANVERDEQVRVVLAVESGSRAWGFASPNSDFDVRFLYVHAEDRYLSLDFEERRDVLEYGITDDIDLNGWDVRKALRLFRKSNPTFVEWLQSPIVYVERGGFAAGARTLLPRVYSCTSGLYHYRNMAATDYRGCLRGDQVPLKKYFYVLRPLLSVLWIERFATAPPIEFERLLPLIDDRKPLRADIEGLLARKRALPEMGRAEPVASIHAFVESELARLKAIRPGPGPRPHVLAELNSLFQATLREPE